MSPRILTRLTMAAVLVIPAGPVTAPDSDGVQVTVTIPSPSPTESPEPDPTDEPTEEPTEDPVDSSGDLPRTGPAVLLIAGAGGALLLAGVVLRVLSRRRRAS